MWYVAHPKIRTLALALKDDEWDLDLVCGLQKDFRL
jgi:hypothetical protein